MILQKKWVICKNNIPSEIYSSLMIICKLPIIGSTLCWYYWYHLLLVLSLKRFCNIYWIFLTECSNTWPKQASFLESLIKDDINILVTKIWCIFSTFTQFALVSCSHLDFENHDRIFSRILANGGIFGSSKNTAVLEFFFKNAKI